MHLLYLRSVFIPGITYWLSWIMPAQWPPQKGGKVPNWNMDCGLDERVLSVVHFLILITMLFLFLGNAHRNPKR